MLGGDLAVGRIGLGTLGLLKAGSDLARAVLERSIDLGVNLIDTADSYGDGAIESFIADTLHPYPEGLVIATKGGQILVDGKARADCRPAHLRAACEASLRRLRLERIDLYQLHSPDPAVPLTEALGALDDLRSEGKVRHVGVSNLSRESFDEALMAVPVVSMQNPYNVSDQGSDSVLRASEQHDLVFFPYYPLGAGTLTGTGGVLGEVAASRGVTSARVALAWLLKRSAVTLPIPCTASVEHLEDNMQSLSLELSDQEFQLLSDSNADGGPALT